jgi:hypothetical protein
MVIWSRSINVPIVSKMLRKHACDILNIERKWLGLISRRCLSQSRRFRRQTLVRSVSKSWITTANTAHRLQRRDKSAADCCSDSSLLRLHVRSPAVVSLPSRVDIPVILHTLFCAMLDNLLGTRLILQQNWLGPETNFLNLNTELFQVQGSSSVFEKLAWNGS